MIQQPQYGYQPNQPPYQQPTFNSQPNKKSGCLERPFWGGIGAMATIAALIVAIISIPQAVPIRQGFSQAFGLTPAPTPSPTPPPQVIQINQTMTCTDCPSDGFYNFSLSIRNATINPANSQVTLLVGVQNNTTGTFDVSFGFLKLQDTQTGVSVDGTGEGFQPFTMTANQNKLLRPTFPFVPVAGHAYSLSAQFSNPYANFTPITIKF